jgi:uncharacterized protein Yka (UPF0111/DUF47 family)
MEDFVKGKILKNFFKEYADIKLDVVSLGELRGLIENAANQEQD